MSDPIFVSGAPRSGQTWLLRLMNDLLDCRINNLTDEEEDYRWCQTGVAPWAIVKTHRYIGCFAQTDMVIGIVRDPRDVAVSRMFQCNLSPAPENLFCVIETMRQATEGGCEGILTFNYPDFVEALLESGRPIIHYEALDEHGPAMLSLMAEQLTGERFSVLDAQASFQRVTLERCKEIDPHFARKGIVGDWHNHFRQKHGKLITAIMGPHLLRRGYVDRLDWWRELPA